MRCDPADQLQALKGLSGPSGPSVPRSVPQSVPENGGCLTECLLGCPQSVSRVSGHLFDTPETISGHSGTRGLKGPGDTPGDTPSDTPVFGDTLGDTPRDTRARRARETSATGRRDRKSCAQTQTGKSTLDFRGRMFRFNVCPEPRACTLNMTR